MATEESLHYKVEKNETISDILYKLELKPIYGDKGYQNRTRVLNRNISITEPLHEGDELAISLKKKDRARLFVKQAPPSSEVVPMPPAPVSSLSHQLLVVDPQVSWMDISSRRKAENQNASVSAQTKPTFGVGLSYGVYWNPDLLLSVSGRVTQLSFYQDEKLSFKRDRFTKTDISLMADVNPAGRHTYSAALGFVEEIFLSLANAQVIQVDVVPVPEAFFSYRSHFLRQGDRRISGALKVKGIAPFKGSKVTTDFGYGGGADLTAFRKKIGLKLFYNYVQLNARAKSSTNHEVGIGLVFERDFYD